MTRKIPAWDRESWKRRYPIHPGFYWVLLAGIGVALACAGKAKNIPFMQGAGHNEEGTYYAGLAEIEFSQMMDTEAPKLIEDMRATAAAIEELWDADDPHITYLNNSADSLQEAMDEYEAGNYTQGTVSSRFTQAAEQYEDSYDYYELGFKLHNTNGLINEIEDQIDAIPGSPPVEQEAQAAADALRSAYDDYGNGNGNPVTVKDRYDDAVDALEKLNDHQLAQTPFPDPYPKWNSTWWDFSSP